jgi:hypothetical protein
MDNGTAIAIELMAIIAIELMAIRFVGEANECSQSESSGGSVLFFSSQLIGLNRPDG